MHNVVIDDYVEQFSLNLVVDEDVVDAVVRGLSDFTANGLAAGEERIGANVPNQLHALVIAGIPYVLGGHEGGVLRLTLTGVEVTCHDDGKTLVFGQLLGQNAVQLYHVAAVILCVGSGMGVGHDETLSVGQFLKDGDGHHADVAVIPIGVVDDVFLDELDRLRVVKEGGLGGLALQVVFAGGGVGGNEGVEAVVPVEVGLLDADHIGHIVQEDLGEAIVTLRGQGIIGDIVLVQHIVGHDAKLGALGQLSLVLGDHGGAFVDLGCSRQHAGTDLGLDRDLQDLGEGSGQGLGTAACQIEGKFVGNHGEAIVRAFAFGLQVGAKGLAFAAGLSDDDLEFRGLGGIADGLKLDTVLILDEALEQGDKGVDQHLVCARRVYDAVG